jgi:hypothetical protein
MRVPTRKIERSCTYVQGLSILPSVSTMFWFEFIQTLCYLFQFHSIFCTLFILVEFIHLKIFANSTLYVYAIKYDFIYVL